MVKLYFQTVSVQAVFFNKPAGIVPFRTQADRRKNLPVNLRVAFYILFFRRFFEKQLSVFNPKINMMNITVVEQTYRIFRNR